MLEHVGDVLPGERGRNHDREPANERAGRDAEHAAAASTTGPPAKPSCTGAVMRITRSSDRPRPVRSGPPITATIPALAVMRIAPGSRDGKRQLANPRLGVGFDGRGEGQALGAKHREAAGRIPSDELRVRGPSIFEHDSRAILAAERPRRGDDDVRVVGNAADGPASSMDLHHGRSDGGNRVGDVIDSAIRGDVLMPPIVAPAAVADITRMGGTGKIDGVR